MHFRKALTAPPSGVITADHESYPRHPITFVVGFPPGGPIHAVGCLIAKFMARELGQKVLIENRPGAAGNLGAESAAHAMPNGYTLYISHRGNTMNQVLYRALDVDMMRDFVPIGLLATAPNVLVVNKNLPARNVAEFISLAKDKPGQLTVGTAGLGSSSHLLCELFKSATRADVLNIPYRGAGPAMVDLVAGRIDAKFESCPSAHSYMREGRLRPLAVASQKRVPFAPTIPTMEESGVPGFFLGNWYGLMAPAGTLSQIAMRLNDCLNHALADSELRRSFKSRGYIVPQGPNSPGALLDLLNGESRKWQAIITSMSSQVP